MAFGKQFVALLGGRVVGWCDIVRNETLTHRHCGVLGMGLMPEHRAKGIGRALIESAIERAWSCGFLRIELGVRESNQPAIKLYENVGFIVEGARRKAARCGDGRYEDTLVMGLLNQAIE